MLKIKTIFKNCSLQQCFKLLPLILFIILSIAFLSHIYIIGQQTHKKVHHELTAYASIISAYFEETIRAIDYQISTIESSLDYNKSQSLTSPDLLKILKLNKDLYGLLSSITITDKDGTIIASDIGDISDRKFNISNRRYVERTKQHLNQKEFGEISYDIINGNRIIPVGYGLADKSHRYIGTVTFRININRLFAKLNTYSPSSDIRFIMLNQKLKPLVADKTFITHLSNSSLLKHIPTINLDVDEGTLESDDLLPFLPFNHEQIIYKKLNFFPFITAIYYEQSYIHDLYVHHLYPAIALYLLTLSIFGLLVFAFYKKTVKPLTFLNQLITKAPTNAKNILGDKLHIAKEFHPILSTILNFHHTKRAYLEQEVTLDKTKKDVHKANLAKAQFLASISHELKTPLNAVIGYAEMIKEEVLGPITNQDYISYSKNIHKSGTDLLRLINDILDVVKSDTHTFTLYEHVVNLTELLNQVVREHTEHARSKIITVHTHVDDNLPLFFGDELRIKQIFYHLLSNAIKFSNLGQTIHITINSSVHGVVIIFQDNGIGIHSQDIPKAMDKFTQVDSSIARKEEGAGLGLWLTNSLVKAHQGTFNIESQPGSGTTVSIIFPSTRIISEKHSYYLPKTALSASYT